MEAISTLRIGARLLALTIAISGTAFAQSAGESFHKAGEQTESAGSGAGHAIVNAARGTATATKDTAITAKVKLSLHNDDVTKSGDIHVTTVEGIVTLRGIVASEKVSEEAQHVTQNTGGVKAVKNLLQVNTAS